MTNLLTKPDRLFLLLAIPLGVLLSLVTIPFGGGDEQHHYQRTAELAYFHGLSRKSPAPAGIVRFRREALATFVRLSPNGYSRQEYARLAAIPLDAARPDTLTMNIFTVHHPINYFVQSTAFRIAAEMNARPLTLLYVARLAGMLAGVALLWLAIRVTPSQKFTMAALALLPGIVDARSTLNADALTSGFAFLFIAVCLRAIVRTARITSNELALIAIAALAIASAKGAYIPLVFLTLALPAVRFSSAGYRAAGVAACIVPATLCGLGWMLAVKHYLFTGYTYRTLAGQPVPDQQLSFILHEPLAYARIVSRTLFETSFLGTTLLGLIGEFSYSNAVLTNCIYGALGTLCLTTTLVDDPGSTARCSYQARVLAFGLALTCVLAALTLLYVQWCEVRAPIVGGFQGRYFLPVLPLVALATPIRVTVRKDLAGRALLALGIIGAIPATSTVQEFLARW